MLMSGVLYGSFFLNNVLMIGSKSISLAEILLFHRQLVDMVSITAVFDGQFCDWYYFVMPLCIGCIRFPLFCEELKSGYWRFVFERKGLRKYTLDTVLAIPLYSVIVFVIADAMYKATLVIAVQNAIIYMNEASVTIIYDSVYNALFVLFISEISLMLSIFVADYYVAVTGSFLACYIVAGCHVSIGILILTVICFGILMPHVLRKRWIEC